MASQVRTELGATADKPAAAERYYMRFEPVDRVMHAFLMITFVGCAITGMPPLFSDQAWAVKLAGMLGGFKGAALIHRICATIMITIFVSHIARVFVTAARRDGLLAILWGPNSMTPQPQDAIDIYNHVRWFVGMGPRPDFDRYTYWEKFDYWAVFWGMFIIGGSGLILWFPTQFATYLPGWIFNVATVVHGEEALLAVGFIFTIHFFNGHLRPEKFPMDVVIFTGRISEHELRQERASEYRRLAREGRLEAMEATPPKRAATLFGYIVGGTAVVLGIAMVLLIVLSFLK